MAARSDEFRILKNNVELGKMPKEVKTFIDRSEKHLHYIDKNI